MWCVSSHSFTVTPAQKKILAPWSGAEVQQDQLLAALQAGIEARAQSTKRICWRQQGNSGTFTVSLQDTQRSFQAADGNSRVIWTGSTGSHYGVSSAVTRIYRKTWELIAHLSVRTKRAATAHSILNLLLFIACVCQRSQSSLKTTHGHDDHTKKNKIKNCTLIHCLAYKTAILRHNGHAGPSNVLQFSVPAICIPALCSNRIVSRKDIRLYIGCLISKENVALSAKTQCDPTFIPLQPALHFEWQN